MPSRVLSIVLALLQVVASVGATPFVVDASRAQFRAAALSGDGGRVFLAAYDRDAVWVFDAATREKLSEIVVGDGPAALALSADGRHLLCANRLGNSVTLIDPATLTVIRTDNVGDAPSSATAIADGRFAVVSTFADTITLVDPASPANQRALDVPALVPTAVAATAGYLGVIGRGEPGALLYPLATLSEPVVVALPGAPGSIVGLPGDSFAIATSAGTVLIGANGGTVSKSAVSYGALTVANSTLYGLGDGAVVELDGQLNEVSRSPLAEPADLLAQGGGRLVAMAPAAKRWQLSGPLAGDTVLAQAAPVAMPQAEAPALAGPSEEPVAEAPAAAADEPATAAPAAQADTPAGPAPEAADETPAPPAWEESDVAVPVEEGATLPTRRRDRLPWSTAPNVDPGMRPSASPLQRIDKSTVEMALVQPTEFGSVEGGFQPPDWREPFKDIKADTMRQELGSDRTTMSGNVNMNMGEMHFRSDEFTYSKEAGQVEASGNVSLDQQRSRLRAGSFSYYLPAEDPTQPTPIFTTSEDEQAFAQQRLAVGHLKAQQVLIEEPTRQLTADDIDFDFGTSKGVLQNVRGRGGILYYKADKITITGPDTAEADEVWVTTCDHDPPHYRIAHKHAEFRDGTIVEGTQGRLQVGKYNTPLWIPKWKRSPEGGWNIDFDSGRRAELGPYLNVGVLFDINPDMQLGPRIFATSNEGIGFGGDAYYDFMESPASPLFRSKGEAHGFYTTKERGHIAWYHRYEPLEKLVVRMQAEQWSDESFYKDFFYDDYKNRTEPRTFANATYREDTWIATATVRPNTHNWVRETERLPEATFHLLDRKLANNLYLSFDTVNGYNNREPSGEGAARSVNVARLTYSLDKVPWLAITPFAELEITGYSKTLDDESSGGRVSGIVGTTLQSRLQRAYGGRWGFDGFKHLIVPSTTVSYRPESSLDLEDTPRFDAYDNVLGRVRIESKLDNILYGRDAVSGQSWQVGRLSLYQGNDLWNEELVANDYEMEFDIRPRPWWGIQGAAERHEIEDGIDLDAPRGLTTFLFDSYENITGEYFLDQEFGAELNSVFADYNRILTQIYYDDTTIGGRLTGRIGFAYTETEGRSYNRDLLYGMGWKFNDKWFARFEHVLNLEDGDLRQQTYEIRRALHCWELGVRFRDREAGFDVDFVLGIRAFPGSRINF